MCVRPTNELPNRADKLVDSFIGSLKSLVCLPESFIRLPHPFSRLKHSAINFSTPNRHQVEATAGLRSQVGNQFLHPCRLFPHYQIVLGYDLNDLFKTVESLFMGLWGHTRILSHATSLRPPYGRNCATNVPV